MAAHLGEGRVQDDRHRVPLGPAGSGGLSAGGTVGDWPADLCCRGRTGGGTWRPWAPWVMRRRPKLLACSPWPWQPRLQPGSSRDPRPTGCGSLESRCPSTRSRSVWSATTPRSWLTWWPAEASRTWRVTPTLASLAAVGPAEKRGSRPLLLGRGCRSTRTSCAPPQPAGSALERGTKVGRCLSGYGRS